LEAISLNAVQVAKGKKTMLLRSNQLQSKAARRYHMHIAIKPMMNTSIKSTQCPMSDRDVCKTEKL